MTGPGASHEGAEPDALEVVTHLWEEYRYRHDMVWRLVFRVTAVATALLIAPFLVDERTQEILGVWLVFLPILALAVILLGFIALPPELKLLQSVKTAYRCEQDRALRHLDSKCYTPHSERPSGKVTGLQRLIPDRFSDRVWAFLFLMLVAAAVFLVLFVVAWLPDIR